MKRLVLAGSLLLTILFGLISCSDKMTPEQKAVIGTWVFSGGNNEQFGLPDDYKADITLTFDENGKFTMEGVAECPSIDVYVGHNWKGTYEVVGENINMKVKKDDFEVNLNREHYSSEAEYLQALAEQRDLFFRYDDVVEITDKIQNIDGTYYIIEQDGTVLEKK